MQLKDGKNVPIRVSIVEWPGSDVVYDEWLIPPGGVDNVGDWLTHVSGATEEIVLAKATKGVDDVVGFLQKNVGRDTILAFHAATNDLKGLQLKPPRNVLDTSLLFEHPELVGNPSGLATLVNRYLQAHLNRRTGHSSVDDARATLELISYLLYWGKHVEFRG